MVIMALGTGPNHEALKESNIVLIFPDGDDRY